MKCLLAVLMLSKASSEQAVCSFENVTYQSYALAMEDKARILHCGPCGACSTLQDVRIYHETKFTLTNTSTECALHHTLLGSWFGSRCMRTKVGFSRPCEACWIENFECTRTHCLGVCLLWKILNQGEPEGLLNPCFACDEKHCGPAFMACAGANRRRAGVVSDIPRPDEQVCKVAEHPLSDRCREL